ncbi:MAG TPA: MBL fold metallo-hydrolase [Micromonosporaceae bacterium]|jgi:glyoxylase-like metal-dependent hydrolase (beta-lactamase superfamily II)
MTAGFVEIAVGVHVLRCPVLDVNSTLILGTQVAVVVDTLATARQARELSQAVRAITDLPLAVVNTHAHFDHCFGNGVLAAGDPGLPIWAHESTVDALRDHGPRLRRAAYDEALALVPAIADDVASTELRAPDRAVAHQSTMDIGDRTVELRYLGRGHTDGDLVVVVPDVAVVVAGDLVEQSAPPSFADSYPLDWPDTLTVLLALQPTLVVPGHGAVVDAGFVHDQRAQLSRLEWLIREGHRDDATPEAVAARAPFGMPAALVAVRRAYAELSGRL